MKEKNQDNRANHTMKMPDLQGQARDPGRAGLPAGNSNASLPPRKISLPRLREAQSVEKGPWPPLTRQALDTHPLAPSDEGAGQIII